MKDLQGIRVGSLTVVSRAENIANRCAWTCICDCGSTIVVRSSNLVRGITRSCGCFRADNLIGRKFGRLTVVGRAENQRTTSGRSIVVWHCVCDCGKEIDARAQNLLNSNTRSCGCLNSEVVSNRSKTHGLSYTRLYTIWCGMKQRCYYQKNNHYKYYGERGISVCKEWKNDFKVFYDWAITHGYRDDLTIDRIDVDGNYCPENCRWATDKEQRENKRKKVKGSE